jgi:hypothetical protein
MQSEEGCMALRYVTALLMTLAATTSAFACQGSTTILADNFQTASPAWHGQLSVSGGRLNLTASGGVYAVAFYGTKMTDSGDACVQMIGPPNLKNPNSARAGIVFGFTDLANYFIFTAFEVGGATIDAFHNGGFLELMNPTPTAALRKGGNTVNTLRVTWKGTSVSTYINNTPFMTLNLHYPVQNGFIGFFADNDESTPTTYQFGNLDVTSVP